MSWALAALFAIAGSYWCRRCKRAEALLSDAGARLSLHYASTLDADVCDRILEHFEGIKVVTRSRV